LPVFVFTRNRRALLPFAAVGGAGVATWVWLGGADGLRQVATFRSSQGWEIESLVGSILRLGSHSSASLENGAYRVGQVPSGASPALLPLGLGAVALVWFLAARAGGSGSILVADGLAPVAAISAMLLASTIISPQYLFWLLPFAAIVAIE